LKAIALKAISERPPEHMSLPPQKSAHTQWFMDQYLLAWKMDKFPFYKNDSFLEQYSGQRIHVSDSFNCADHGHVRDVHIKYSSGSWPLIRSVFACFVKKEDMDLIDEFQNKFQKLI